MRNIGHSNKMRNHSYAVLASVSVCHKLPPSIRGGVNPQPRLGYKSQCIRSAVVTELRIRMPLHNDTTCQMTSHSESNVYGDEVQVEGRVRTGTCTIRLETDEGGSKNKERWVCISMAIYPHGVYWPRQSSSVHSCATSQNQVPSQLKTLVYASILLVSLSLHSFIFPFGFCV